MNVSVFNSLTLKSTIDRQSRPFWDASVGIFFMFLSGIFQQRHENCMEFLVGVGVLLARFRSLIVYFRSLWLVFGSFRFVISSFWLVFRSFRFAFDRFG